MKQLHRPANDRQEIIWIADYRVKHYMASPNGKIWEIKVDNLGVISSEDTGETI